MSEVEQVQERRRVIHDAHAERERVCVCVASATVVWDDRTPTPYTLSGCVVGVPVSVEHGGFVLAGMTFQTRIAWGDVREAWKRDKAPDPCPYCGLPAQPPTQPLPTPGRAGSEGEHPIVEAIEYEEEPGRAGTERVYLASAGGWHVTEEGRGAPFVPESSLTAALERAEDWEDTARCESDEVERQRAKRRELEGAIRTAHAALCDPDLDRDFPGSSSIEAARDTLADFADLPEPMSSEQGLEGEGHAEAG